MSYPGAQASITVEAVMLTQLLRTYLLSYRRPLAAVVTLQLIGTIASLYLPTLNADIIDRGVARGDTGYIVSTGGVMLVVTVVQIVCSIAAVYFGAQTAMGFGRDVRAAVFARVGTFSAREVATFGAPSLITRSTNDVQQVQMVVLTGCTLLVMAPIMCVGGIIMALRQDLGLSWLLVVSIPLLLAAVTLIIRRMVPLFRAMQAKVDGLNRILREQIAGIRVVRAFVREPFETTRFEAGNAALTDTAVRSGRLMALMFPTVMLVFNASSVAVLWFGGHRVDAGQIQVGSLMAFLNYLVQILMSVMLATFMAAMLPRAAVSAERIGEVLDTEASVRPPATAAPAPVGPDRAELVLDAVEYRYPGAEAPVLRNISFRAMPGTTTAIVGSTGSGKTTLISLVPRLFDVTAGAVRVGGVDVREFDPDTLWRRVGLVPQRPYLFTGTVASNLRYGNPDATDEQLWTALSVAQANDFVADLPGGLAAPIAQGGTNVSGGQRQRLAIARALVREPDIYLFDDAFSALDLSTDARLRAALVPYTRDATVLIVAQRVSTIMSADQIVVLDGGEVVGLGQHAELLETCPTYAEIVDSQLDAGVPA
jgi:ATP-binding cassette, subfamily B, multidrug efflux pump